MPDVGRLPIGVGYCSADGHRSTSSATRARWNQKLALTIKRWVAADGCGNPFPNWRAESVTENFSAVHWRNFLSNAKVGSQHGQFWGQIPESATQPRCQPISTSAVFPGRRVSKLVGSLGKAGMPAWPFDGFGLERSYHFGVQYEAGSGLGDRSMRLLFSPSTSHVCQAAFVVVHGRET